MSLIVSLRIPDGLVIAADSLATMQSQIQVAASVASQCPKCNQPIELKDLNLPPIPVASSTRSFSQKLISFQRRYGVGTTGMGAVNNRTIYHHIKSIEHRHDKEFNGLDDVGSLFAEYFHAELKKQIPNLDQAPENYAPLGLQVVGYDGDEAKTLKVDIGKNVKSTPYTGIGCTVSGDTKLVTQLWSLAKEDPRQHAVYKNFSLQDAIDYAEFLIKTTAAYQRFANLLPSVGGDIDIALITPYKDFTWIQSKRLTRILEPQDSHSNQ